MTLDASGDLSYFTTLHCRNYPSLQKFWEEKCNYDLSISKIIRSKSFLSMKLDFKYSKGLLFSFFQLFLSGFAICQFAFHLRQFKFENLTIMSI